MSILDLITSPIKSVISGVENVLSTPLSSNPKPIVNQPPVAFPNRVTPYAPVTPATAKPLMPVVPQTLPTNIKSAISAPIASVVKPQSPVGITSAISKPISSVVPNAPTVNTNTKEYLDSQSTTLGQSSKEIETENATLATLQKQLNTSKTKVDDTDQNSIDRYNALVNEYNSRAQALQSKITNFNTSVDDYKNKVSAYNFSGGQTISRASDVPSTPAPKPGFFKNANQLNPNDQFDINVRIPFTQKFISHTSPFDNPIVFGGQRDNLANKGLNMIANFPTDVIQAIPRALDTIKNEIQSYGKSTAQTKKLGGVESALYGSPEYTPTYKDIKNRIENGDGLLSAYIGGISNKVLDVAFGAQVVASSFATLSKVLSSGNSLAKIEAWKTLGSPTTEEELKANFRQLAQQFHPDKTGGSDLPFKTISNANTLLKGNLPSIIDFAKANGGKYTEWISRQTPLTNTETQTKETNQEPGVKTEKTTTTTTSHSIKNLLHPDLELKDIQPARLGLKELPGTAPVPGQAPAFGMSTQAVEHVGYEEPVIDAETGQPRQTSQDQTGQDIKSLIAKPIGEVVGTAQVGETTIPIKKGGELNLPEPKTPGLFDQPQKPQLPVYQGEKDLTTQTLQKLVGRSSVSKTFIENLTNQPELKQQERDVVRAALKDYKDGSQVPVQEFANKVKAELLPLERKGSAGSVRTGEGGREGFSQARYEGITLPKEIRGEVQNYSENIYSSPIKTSAGHIHFSGRPDAENYFGHTRTEEMAPNYIPGERVVRQIENQSDLYQKGRLDEHGRKAIFGLSANEDGDMPVLGERNIEAEKEFAKLSQYTNPTAHFRMLREEIKYYAKKGFDTMLIPTGETAMKIEGLGNQTTFLLDKPGGPDIPIKSQDLKVGLAVSGNGGAWIITDVLGDGKFKAVSKDRLPSHFEYMESNGKTRYEGPGGTRELHDGKYTLKDFIEEHPNMSETFDISGKVDTNNPIYKFYEKEMGREVKNKYAATLFTDSKGVTYWKFSLKAPGKPPVSAFKRKIFSNLPGTRLPLDEITKAIYADIPASQVKLIFSNELIDGVASGEYRTDPFRGINKKLKPIIELYTEGGLASLDTAYHESGHYILDNFMTKAEKQGFIDQARAEMGPMRDLGYKLKGYRKSADQRAEEFLMDKYAEAKKKGGSYDPKYKSFFDRMDEILKKIIETYKKVVSHVQKLLKESGEGGYIKNPLADETGQTSQTGQDMPSEKAKALTQKGIDLEKLNYEYQTRKETLSNNPLRGLEKYVSKGGENPGLLPEIGVGKSKFAREADTIIDEVIGHGKYAEDVRNKFNEEYLPQKAALVDLRDEIRQKAAEFKTEVKAAANAAEEERVAKLDQEIIHLNNGVYPLPVRGGITAPEIVWHELKDRPTIALTRETMERNLEHVAKDPAVAKKLNGFLVEPIRANETARVEYSNKIKLAVRAKMKELGIAHNSLEDKLVQMLGEGRIDIGHVETATKKWKEVQKAVQFSRQLYDNMIEDWNTARAQYGYKPVGKRENYFRHFNEINDFVKDYGFLTNDSQLPTEISGQTKFFSPGKPFSTAELRRIGDKTKYSAIGGLDNYIDTVSRQMFHIDSIQRGRALTNYLSDAAIANPKGNPNPVVLPNFMANLREYTQLVAGKSASIDQGIAESLLGRPVLKGLQKMTDLIGRNIILGNISSALSHLIPMTLTMSTTGKVALVKGLTDTLVRPFQKDIMINEIDGQKSSFLTRRFPERYIMPTMFEKGQMALGAVFHFADQFISYATVASKYYEGIDAGMSPIDAMARADAYAVRVIGDRSIGNLPNLMNTKSLGILTRFQFEINDNLSVLTHDIAKWSGEEYDPKTKTYKEGSGGAKKTAKIVSALVQFVVYSHLLNLVYKKIRGAGKGIDPLEWGMELLGLTDTTSGLTFVDRAKTAGTDALGELPFSSLFTGNNPTATVIQNIFGANIDMKDRLATFALNFNPLGGGTQLKKTYQGLKAYLQGFDTTLKGRKTYDIQQNAGNFAKAALFGKTALPENQNYWNGINKSTLLKSENKSRIQKIYDDAQALPTQAERDKVYARLSPADRVVYSNIKTAEKAAKTLARKPAIEQLYEKTQKLSTQAERDKVFAGLSAEDRKIYSEVKKADKKLRPKGR